MISSRIPKVVAFSYGNGSVIGRPVSFGRSMLSRKQPVRTLPPNLDPTPSRRRSSSLCLNAATGTGKSTGIGASRRDRSGSALSKISLQAGNKYVKLGNSATKRRKSQSFPLLMAAAGVTVMSAGATNSENPLSSVSLAYCQGDSPESNSVVTTPPFDESALTFDHYNGVTLHLDKIETTGSDFKKDLSDALLFWKAEGRKGIWINAPKSAAHFVPDCMALGFDFHFVKEKVLILSQWLPEDSPSRLPLGPTHQVGIGTVVLKPDDPTKMLVVQEKSGPAAAYKLWKMPTGLLDPGEDIQDAATRELLEETGLEATMKGILCFRQAHSPRRTSDLFFVCRLDLTEPNQEWKSQPEEIAEIQWMKVEDYCKQQRWQGSSVYEALNESILKLSKLETELLTTGSVDNAKVTTTGLIRSDKLPLGFSQGTNALFRSQL